jgi:hypothetical protein
MVPYYRSKTNPPKNENIQIFLVCFGPTHEKDGNIFFPVTLILLQLPDQFKDLIHIPGVFVPSSVVV